MPRQHNTHLFAAHAAIGAEIERLDHLIGVYESGPRSIGQKEYRNNSRRFYELCDERDDVDDAIVAESAGDLDEMAYKAKTLARVLETTPPEPGADILREFAQEILVLADMKSREKWVYFRDAVGSHLSDLQGF
jgi:hypothetical protein